MQMLMHGLITSSLVEVFVSGSLSISLVSVMEYLQLWSDALHTTVAIFLASNGRHNAKVEEVDSHLHSLPI